MAYSICRTAGQYTGKYPARSKHNPVKIGDNVEKRWTWNEFEMEAGRDSGLKGWEQFGGK